MAGLKPSDLFPMAADTQATDKGAGMTTEQRQAVTLTAAHRGMWVPNEDDSGLLLVGKLQNGTMIPMRKSDGSRIELPFSSVGNSQAPAAAPGGEPPPQFVPTP